MFISGTENGKSPILAAVDLSAASKDVLILAADLAVQTTRQLVILHVVHDRAGQPSLYARQNEHEQAMPLEEVAYNRLQICIREARTCCGDGDVFEQAVTIVVDGLPASRIIEIARRVGASRIVMGSNGRTFLSRLFSGSVADRVVRNSHVPVAVVHSHHTGAEFDRTPPGNGGDREVMRAG